MLAITNPTNTSLETEEFVASSCDDCHNKNKRIINTSNLRNILKTKSPKMKAKKKKGMEEKTKNYGSNIITNLLSTADKRFLSSDFEGALILYSHILPLAIKVLGNNSPTIGDIHVKISVIQEGNNDFDGALQSLIRALETYNEMPTGRQQIKILNTINSIANIHVFMGDIHKAEKCYEDVIEVSKRVFGYDSNRVAMSLNNMGNFLSGCAHNHSKAILVLTEALRIQHKGANGHMDSTFASTLNNMGKAYELRSRMGDNDRAEKCYLQALKVFRYSMVSSDDHEIAVVLHNLYNVRELLKKKKQNSAMNNINKEGTIHQEDSILEKISEEIRDEDDDEKSDFPASYNSWTPFCFSSPCR